MRGLDVHGQEEKMDVDGPSGSEFEVILRCVQKEGPKFSTRVGLETHLHLSHTV